MKEGIIGARIKEAREEAGMSQSQLAASIGITRAGISKIEAGSTVNPSAETIALLSAKLNKPIDFFYTEYIDDFSIETTPTYRSFANTSKKDNERVDIIIRRLSYFIGYIFKIVYDREVKLPDMPINPSSKPISNEEIENLAAEVRTCWKIPEGPVLNLINRVENNGIICLGFDLPETIDSVNVSIKFSECTYSLHPVIIYNNNLTYYRQRFTIAHEIGHIMLHSKWTEAEYKDNHTIAEKQAHRFATALMMPANVFRSTVGKTTVNGALSIKNLWGMSIAAIGRRMWETGKLSDDRYKSFCIDLSQRKWRKEEPGDRDIEPEHPYYLDKIYGMAFERHCISTMDVVRDFGLYPQEIIKYIGNCELFMANPDENFEIKEEDNDEEVTR